MMYLVFDTIAEATTRNHQEAMARGCSESGSTQYWWSMISHDDGRAALKIPDADVSGMTVAEQSALTDYATMDADGWFPDADY